MTNATLGIEVKTIELKTGALTYMEGGTGPDLLLLHHDIGSTGWGELHERLAEHFHVVAPNMPGYLGSKRLDWARHPRDLAGVVLAFVRNMNLSKPHLVGLGFGGWIAAEMATFSADSFSSLSLVAAAGMRPDNSYVLDQVMMDYPNYIIAGFSGSEQAEPYFPLERKRDFKERFDENREVIARITWKPYMYSYELPELLPEMHLPTLIAWGTADKVVPVECAQKYAELIPNNTIRYIESGCHFLDLEHPAEIASYIVEHTGISAGKE